MQLPVFRYHPDPVASGSVEKSEKKCKCCGEARGYIYTIAPYAEEDLEDSLCPWCIADGSSHVKFDVTFVDEEAFGDEIPEAVQDEIAQRTPGFAMWQGDYWPGCCKDAAVFRGPTGIAEIRKNNYQLEGLLMGHIVHEMGISGGAARRLLDSLDVSKGPTAYVFECSHCLKPYFHIDTH